MKILLATIISWSFLVSGVNAFASAESFGGSQSPNFTRSSGDSYVRSKYFVKSKKKSKKSKKIAKKGKKKSKKKFANRKKKSDDRQPASKKKNKKSKKGAKKKKRRSTY
jgi:hypothetical protein